MSWREIDTEGYHYFDQLGCLGRAQSEFLVKVVLVQTADWATMATEWHFVLPPS